MRKLLTILLFFQACILSAQMKEQRVFLWDVTGSLLPKETGVKDLGGHELPAYSQGNGLYVKLQQAIVDAVNSVEENPMNTIIVAPFQENPLCVWEAKATKEGKAKIVQQITEFKYRPHKHTSIVNAMSKFRTLRKSDCINYMFLYTDGKDDFPSTTNNFINTVRGWNPDSYGFYVFVHPDANIADKVGNKPKNFWFVNDANVQIKVVSMPKELTYNVKNDKQKTISLSGNFAKVKNGCKLKLTVANNPNYSISLKNATLQDGKVTFAINKKSGNPPVNYDLHVSVTQVGGDPYTFIAPSELVIHCLNKPEKVLNIGIKPIKK